MLGFDNPCFLEDSLPCFSPPGVKLVRKSLHGQSSSVRSGKAHQAGSTNQLRASHAIRTCSLNGQVGAFSTPAVEDKTSVELIEARAANLSHC
jgi:hypothetical protein